MTTGGKLPSALPSALCPLPSTLCPLPSALCPLSSVLCPLSSALCPLPSALCPLPFLLRSPSYGATSRPLTTALFEDERRARARGGPRIPSSSSVVVALVLGFDPCPNRGPPWEFIGSIPEDPHSSVIVSPPIEGKAMDDPVCPSSTVPIQGNRLSSSFSRLDWAGMSDKPPLPQTDH